VVLICCFVFGACLVYALSFGPALRIARRGAVPGQVLPKWVYVTYGPLFRAKALLPQQIQDVYERYLDLWVPEPVSTGADQGFRPAKQPNKSLQATATSPRVFGRDMKFDCQICIGESGSVAVPELGR